MKTFEKLNTTKNNVCALCGTNKEGKAVLVRIVGTEEGNICVAKQVHLECLPDFAYDPATKLLYAVQKDVTLEDKK